MHRQLLISCSCMVGLDKSDAPDACINHKSLSIAIQKVHIIWNVCNNWLADKQRLTHVQSARLTPWIISVQLWTCEMHICDRWMHVGVCHVCVYVRLSNRRHAFVSYLRQKRSSIAASVTLTSSGNHSDIRSDALDPYFISTLAYLKIVGWCSWQKPRV